MLDRALVLARRAGDQRQECNVLGNLGNLLFDKGELDESRAYYGAALVMTRETGNRRIEGNTLCNLAGLEVTLERYDQAVVHLERCLLLARDLGHVKLECIAMLNLGIAEEGLGRAGKARECYEAAQRITPDDPRAVGMILAHLGVFHARQLDFAAARECLDAAERRLRAIGDTLNLGLVFASRAETECRAGEWDAARKAFREAEAVVLATGASPHSELGCALARAAKLLNEA